MSVRMLSAVWEKSRHSGNDLLMLLALADFADDDGRSYPSVATLARKCRMTSRNVNLILAELRKSGELQVHQNQGPKGTNLYRLSLKNSSPLKDPSPLKNPSATPEGFFPTPLKKPSAEPSMNRQEPSDMADKPLVSSKAAASCPHEEIIELYHQILPTGRRVRIWNDTRMAKLRARWKEDPKRQSLEWWAKFFNYIAESHFLSGKTATTGRPPFELDLEWIVSPANFVKIVEGKYHRETAA